MLFNTRLIDIADVDEGRGWMMFADISIHWDMLPPEFSRPTITI